ncbi:MAG TPA: galactokinase [Candidatus Paceibacterota bacterium]|nr:galactokinase [Verrucomicrobiota bacterium]HSA12458.1 galactokinase [Candidatus Paceibacterota bacterium]
MDSIADRSAELFERCFGHSPRWLVAAPGRVNLIGEHTDYNDGFVLPMAIERHIVIAAHRNPGREVTLHSVTTGETAAFNMRPEVTPGSPGWSNYVRGVIAGFQRRGTKLPAFDAVIESTLPFGGGLASSAALEVATATLLESIAGPPLDPVEKALLCQHAEHDYAGVPCGIMDQFTSILAQENHALLLDCRSRTTTLVPMTNPDVTVLIVNTEIRHKLAESEYAKRRTQCEIAARALKVASLRDATPEMLEASRGQMDPVAFRRARHVITENARTLEAAKAIQASEWPAVGQLMYASHASLRDDYEVSCPELDAVVEVARAIGAGGGVIGCRMTGGGFGGCAVLLVETEAVQRLTRKLDEAYERKTGRQTSIFSSRPAAGACVLKAG